VTTAPKLETEFQITRIGSGGTEGLANHTASARPVKLPQGYKYCMVAHHAMTTNVNIHAFKRLPGDGYKKWLGLAVILTCDYRAQDGLLVRCRPSSYFSLTQLCVNDYFQAPYLGLSAI
jgi:hypothetical protein